MSQDSWYVNEGMRKLWMNILKGFHANVLKSMNEMVKVWIAWFSIAKLCFLKKGANLMRIDNFFCQEEFLHLTGDGLTCFLLVQEFTYLWREMISRDFTRWRIKIWGKVFCWMYQFHGFYCKVHGNILYTEWITLFEPNFSLIIYWGQAKNRFLKLNLFFPSMWN